METRTVEHTVADDRVVTVPVPFGERMGSVVVGPDATTISIPRPPRTVQPTVPAVTQQARSGAPVFKTDVFEHANNSETTVFDKAPPSYPGSEKVKDIDSDGSSQITERDLEFREEPPSKKGNRAYRYLRWNFGSVYRRIFTLAFIVNAAVLLYRALRMCMGEPPLSADEAINAVSANLLAAMIVRNEHVVNIMFVVFGTWPYKLPIRLKRLAAKVYSYGGIHSGGGVAATAWFISFIAIATKNVVDKSKDGMGTAPDYVRIGTMVIGYLILSFLLLILVFAYPTMRVKYHNSFEHTHRFLGWSIVALFWALVMLTAAGIADKSDTTFGRAVIEMPSFWMLVVITLLVIYPWTRLRKHDVESVKLSNHAVQIKFSHRDAHYGQAIRLTDDPLFETHAFATIPNTPAVNPKQPASQGYTFDGFSPAASPRSEEDKQLSLASVANSPDAVPDPFGPAGKKGFSVVISAAGDWTKRMIANPPTKMYTRGVPQYGVLRVAGMFEPCIVVATGSGIAPCLSLFVEKPDHPVRIVWSTKDPIKTYGYGVLNAVKKADPDAVIWDTSAKGRPDLVKIVHSIWEESKRGAATSSGSASDMEEGRAGSIINEKTRRRNLGPCEAVVIISNQKVTRKVVYGLESRGVPAYGAIFDS